jgi:hypothetical protein
MREDKDAVAGQPTDDPGDAVLGHDIGMDARQVLIRSWAEAKAKLAALKKPDPPTTPEAVAYFLAVDAWVAQCDQLQQQIADCERHLKDLVNRYGECVDEESGHRVYIDQKLTWEYDTLKWLALAPEGSHRRRALEEALTVTLTSKAIAQALKDGIVSEMELDAHKVRTRRVHSRTLHIVPVGE